MKAKFKLLIALTVLLATGQLSFGQGEWGSYGPFPFYVPVNDTNNDGVIDRTDSAYCYNEWAKNQYGHPESSQSGSFTEEHYTEIREIEIEEVEDRTTCDKFTVTWNGNATVEYYGINLYEYDDKRNSIKIHDKNNRAYPHTAYSYYIVVDRTKDRLSNTTFTFENLKPGTWYEVGVTGYNFNSMTPSPVTLEDTRYWEYFYTEPITISSSDNNEWGAAGSVVVEAPTDCEVIKWDYDSNVLVKRDVKTSKTETNYEFTKKYGYKFTCNFEVLKYNTKTKVTATIRCKSSGKVYTRDITITIKPLNLYCESKVWRCNSVIKMNLENAPASLKTVKWTSSDNLQICYSGFNNTIKYAYFQAKGTGSAWIKASFTYNGITYTKQFSYSIIPKSASYMANKPITDVYTDSTDVLLLSVDELNMESQESSFIVYPNPATTELNIKQTVSSGNLSLEEDGAIKTVDIFDVKGNKCASHVFNDAQTTATIDITDLANGIFILVINKDSNDAQTCSFVKK